MDLWGLSNPIKISHFSLTSIKNVMRLRKDMKENSPGFRERHSWCTNTKSSNYTLVAVVQKMDCKKIARYFSLCVLIVFFHAKYKDMDNLVRL